MSHLNCENMCTHVLFICLLFEDRHKQKKKSHTSSILSIIKVNLCRDRLTDYSTQLEQGTTTNPSSRKREGMCTLHWHL